MAFIVDIIIVALLALSIIMGYKRGLVKTLFGCFSLIAAILLASLFGAPVGSAIKNSFLFDGVEQSVTNEISSKVDDVSGLQAQTPEGEEMPQNSITMSDGQRIVEDFANSDFGKTVFRLGVNEEQIKRDFANAIDNGINTFSGATDIKGLLVSIIAGPVLDCIASALGTVIVFIVSLILLKILCFFIDKLFKLPILNTLNKYGGLVAGIISGFIGVFALCMIMETMLPIIPENPVVYVGMSEHTLLYRFFVNLNPVISLLLG